MQPFIKVFEDADLRQGITPEEPRTHLMYHLRTIMSISHHHNTEKSADQLTKVVVLLLHGLVSK